MLVLPLFQRAGTTPMTSARGALASWKHSKRPHQGKIYSCGVVLLLSRTLCPRKVVGLILIRSTKSKNPNPFPIGEEFGFLLSGTAFCVPMQFIPSTRNRHSRLRRHFDRPGFPVWSGGQGTGHRREQIHRPVPLSADGLFVTQGGGSGNPELPGW